MTQTLRPLVEINQHAMEILVRELGVVDAHRFLSQFRSGAGDYTTERRQWLDNLSLQDIVSQIKAKRRKPRRGR